MLCSECGSSNVRLSAKPLKETFRGEEFVVSGLEYYVCDDCDEVVMSLAMADKQAKEMAKQYRKAHHIPSGEEIKSFRKSLGLSQKEFEQYIGVATPTVSRWETEAVIPSIPVASLLIHLINIPEAKEEQFKISRVKNRAQKCKVFDFVQYTKKSKQNSKVFLSDIKEG
ncbi:MAG: type II toxin-antitoxin system MqsA family antitoxin [Atopobium sp.]|uniref:type II TA system antitoxin MqsA family protein n=1 Tax=Atopobium sp. TaxID=1872650 RepID=UPI002A7EBD1C|nr:type II TA system antitoxin MqsA family protein [Atopobium sp.]MDY4521982.1 type II toxin-antitoxin system MqsA family antitoxin [Atopobium sp.]